LTFAFDLHARVLYYNPDKKAWCSVLRTIYLSTVWSVQRKRESLFPSSFGINTGTCKWCRDFMMRLCLTLLKSVLNFHIKFRRYRSTKSIKASLCLDR